jgi:hypothetical protein
MSPVAVIRRTARSPGDIGGLVVERRQVAVGFDNFLRFGGVFFTN